MDAFTLANPTIADAALRRARKPKPAQPLWAKGDAAAGRAHLLTTLQAEAAQIRDRMVLRLRRMNCRRTEAQPTIHKLVGDLARLEVVEERLRLIETEMRHR